MGTGLLVLFYSAFGCVIGLVVGRVLRHGTIFAALAGIAAVLLADRFLVPLVSWDDPFFWEGELRLIAFALLLCRSQPG